MQPCPTVCRHLSTSWPCLIKGHFLVLQGNPALHQPAPHHPCQRLHPTAACPPASHLSSPSCSVSPGSGGALRQCGLPFLSPEATCIDVVLGLIQPGEVCADVADSTLGSEVEGAFICSDECKMAMDEVDWTADCYKGLEAYIDLKNLPNYL